MGYEPIDPDVFPGRNSKQAATIPTTTIKGTSSEPAPAWWEYVGHKFMQGAAAAKGGLEDAAASLQSPEAFIPILPAARVLGVPREWVNKFSYFPVTGDTFGYDKQMRDTTYAPLEKTDNSIVEHVGTMAKGAGGAVMTPFPIKSAVQGGKAVVQAARDVASTFGRNAIIGAGAAEGGEVGKFVGEGTQRVFNDFVLDKPNDSSGPMGPVMSLVGGLAGGIGAATVKAGALTHGASTTADAASAGAKAAGSFAGRVGTAVKETVKASRENDERGLFEIFSNNFKMFGAESKSQDAVTKMVMARLANAMEGDPAARASFEQWLKDTRKLVPPHQLKDFQAMFDSAQATENKALAGLIRDRIENPVGVKSGTELGSKNVKLADSLGKLYQQYVGVAGFKPKDIKQAFEDLRDTHNLTMKAHNAQELELKGSFASPSADNLSAQGMGIKAGYEAEKAVSTAKVNELYANARQAGDATGIQYDLTPTLKEVEKVLATAGSEATGGAMGAGTTGRRLRDYLSKESVVFGQDGDINLFRPLKYSEADELGKALNSAISDARAAGDGFKVRNLVGLKKQLNSDILAQSPENVKKLRQDADAFFANEHGPRFKEGINSQLDRQGASGAKTGVDTIPDVDVLGKYVPASGPVDERTLQQFDNAFGETFKGGARNEAAYAQLEQYAEGVYRHRVFGPKGEFNLAKHEEFLEDMSPVFKRVPGLEEKVTQAAGRAEQLAREKEAIETSFREIADGSLPVAGSVGPEVASRLLTKALSDPRRMSKLVDAVGPNKKALVYEVLKTGGVRDIDGRISAENLSKVLYAGRSGPGSPSGLEVLLRATYGQKEGPKLFSNLEALQRLVARSELTDPRYIRPKDEFAADPIKAISGQTGASWVNQFYTIGSGRTSAAYTVATPVFRKILQEVGKKIAVAEEKMLHTPDGVEALLEMYGKQAGDQVSKQTLNTISKYGGVAVEKIEKALSISQLGGITKASAKEAVRQELEQQKEGDK